MDHGEGLELIDGSSADEGKGKSDSNLLKQDWLCLKVGQCLNETVIT